MDKIIRIVLWHLLLWLVVFLLAIGSNSGNYKGNIVWAALYFVLFCSPVFYAMVGLLQYGLGESVDKIKLTLGLLLLYLFCIPYTYVFVYHLLPMVDVYFFNPKGLFTWDAFTGTVLVEFVTFLILAFLIVLWKRYGGVSVDLVKIRFEQRSAGLEYQLNEHLDGKLLAFVANMEASAGNWQNYELICSLNEIKSYARRVHANNERLVSLEEEWSMVCKLVDVVHTQMGCTGLIKLRRYGNSQNQLLPPFTLLTLVENIAEYARLEREGDVLIDLEVREDRFSYYSENRVNKKKRPSWATVRGHGMQLVKERLELQLKGRYSFSATIEDNSYFVNLNVTS